MNMKKVIISVMMCIVSLASWAHDIEIDGIFYNLDQQKKEAEVTFKGNVNGSYNNEYFGAVNIPTTISHNGVTYSVTAIGETAFISCDALISVSIPNSVKNIGKAAFSQCTGLITVTLPNTLSKIEKSVFYCCRSLTSINFPKSLTTIEEKAFGGCSSLISANIPNSVTLLGKDAFSYCSSLVSVNIPNTITEIKEGVFNNCKGLESIIIPNTVKEIGFGAFQGCTGLTSITLPNSVTYIENQAFLDCKNLTAVNISSLEAWCNIDIRGWNPLYYAHNLYLNGTLVTDLEIPEGITKIGNEAFSGGNFTSVSIPNSVKSIGNRAFWGCSNLSSVTIPSAVTSIGDYAFWQCYDLSSAIIPNSVTKLGYSAFRNCSSLTTITIPESCQTVSEEAFYGCSKLKTLVLPSTLIALYDKSFDFCDIEEIWCYAQTPPVIYGNTFYEQIYSKAMLYVPSNSVENYQTHNKWGSFINILSADGSQPETKKCAKPSISYESGKLIYSTETEEATIVSEIKNADVKKSYGTEVTLGATYEISAYATKPGYENSDVATAILHWLEATFKTNGIEQILGSKRAILVSTIDGGITISGLNSDEKVVAYNIDGTLIDSVRATGNNAYIHAETGNIVVLKVGKETIKILVK